MCVNITGCNAHRCHWNTHRLRAPIWGTSGIAHIHQSITRNHWLACFSCFNLCALHFVTPNVSCSQKSSQVTVRTAHFCSQKSFPTHDVIVAERLVEHPAVRCIRDVRWVLCTKHGGGVHGSITTKQQHSWQRLANPQ